MATLSFTFVYMPTNGIVYLVHNYINAIVYANAVGVTQWFSQFNFKYRDVADEDVPVKCVVVVVIVFFLFFFFMYYCCCLVDSKRVYNIM